MSEQLRLEQEVIRLSQELDQAVAEKEQAAQYGLVLLEEKDSLEARCQELENLYDNTKHDLQATQEALAKFQSSQQVSTRTGIEHEESLLSESAARETSLNSQIIEMELDLKSTKAELERLRTEKAGAMIELANVKQEHSTLETELMAVKKELKGFRHRETLLITEYSELEEENIALQKQVSSLRSTTVEFEGAKHEIRHLQEEVDLLNSQVEELTNLKRIAEKQLEEALESLQAEREQRYTLKKELDAKNNSESMFQLGNLALSIQGMSGSQGAPSSIGSEGDEESPVFKKVEAGQGEGDGEAQVEGEDAAPPAEDLFSEIHLGQLKKLEKQLESTETEKVGLSASLKDLQSNLDQANREAANNKSKVAELLVYMATLDRLIVQDPDSVLYKLDPTAVESDMKGNLAKHQTWQAKCVHEMQSIKKNIEHIKVEDKGIYDALTKLKSESNGLRVLIQTQEKSMSDLNHDVRIIECVAAEVQSVLGVTQNDLGNVSEELAKIYHHICTSQNITPSRVMLQHSKGPADVSSTSDKSSDFSPSKVEMLRTKLRTLQFTSPNESTNFGDAETVRTMLETIKDQLKYLKSSVESSLERSSKKQVSAVISSAPSDSENSTTEIDLQETQEQVVKLKSLLSTKREQIATLRTVLKANKQTAELALSTLKSKYDTEKAIVSETMLKLRNELKILKEDAATFSTLRAMFGARCEEYSTQVDELQRQLICAEDEKKTLNQLLRMAIHQKLVLTQKLEDIEVQSEIRPIQGASRRGGHRKGNGGGYGGAPRAGGRTEHRFQSQR